MWKIFIIGVLGLISIVEFLYILSLKKNINIITTVFSKILSSDTNALICVNTSDPDIRKLASMINSELKELRKEKLRIQRGDHELKNVITNVAHDLRTPLTAINGYLELLEEEMVNENVARYLGVIKERTEALKRLTEDLFRYSIVTSTSENLELELLSLKSELEIALAGSYGMLCESGIVPEIKLSNLETKKALNHTALQRIFSNILNNCAKYSDGDLKVELKDTGEIIFSNRANNLSEVETEKLFDRFFTVENGKASTGLGLSIAKALTKKMNGMISACWIKGTIYITILFN